MRGQQSTWTLNGNFNLIKLMMKNWNDWNLNIKTKKNIKKSNIYLCWFYLSRWNLCDGRMYNDQVSIHLTNTQIKYLNFCFFLPQWAEWRKTRGRHRWSELFQSACTESPRKIQFNHRYALMIYLVENQSVDLERLLPEVS